ncbi:hypothetical protein TNCT_433021 [Trichonephila clavata]|uniref:Uncharacterized protein n=1 Tax=Trichonephila clavata TaxID=2740835 RepID=A0A8X6ICC8_TRICU|nr:hypothetical protein TNCT_433021 [Trichonephila clavata]
MQEKSVLEQENVADTYDGPSYIIVDKNALCDIFKYTLCGICNQSTLKLEFGHKYGFSHQLKLDNVQPKQKIERDDTQKGLRNSI